MLCIITLKVKDSDKSEIIYSTNSFGNAVYMLEELAFRFLETLKGIGNEIYKKLPNVRGIYAVSSLNRIIIYEKFKNGWIFNGGERKIYDLELIKTYTPNTIKAEYKQEIKSELIKNFMDEVLEELLITVKEYNNPEI